VFCNFKNLPIQEWKEKTMRNGTQALMNSVVHATEQPTYAVVGTLLQFVSTPERNGGNLSVMRGGIPPRTIIPLHSHASPEGAAKLAANPAGEGPASRTCPVATVVIPDGGEGDLSRRRLRSKSPSRQSASSVGSVRGASKSAGCSERSEPLAAKRRPTGSGLWWDR